jgi:hypothetical protein
MASAGTLLARCLDRAIGHFHVAGRARFDFLRDLRRFNALQAESAFLHHTAHADGHFRVLDQLQQFPFFIFTPMPFAIVQPRLESYSPSSFRFSSGVV